MNNACGVDVFETPLKRRRSSLSVDRGGRAACSTYEDLIEEVLNELFL